MDSILNFNSSVGSQDVEQEWKMLMPDLVNSLQKRNGRGDFLAVFNRDVSSDETLRAVFQEMWDKNDGPGKGFGLENFKMAGLSKEPNLTQLADHVNLLRSDHSRFWVGNHKNYFASLPAIVLTDTGPSRGKMRQCYHAACDIYNFRDSGDINWKFFTQTVQSLIDTVVSLSHSSCRTKRNYKHFTSWDGAGDYLFKEKKNSPDVTNLNAIKPNSTTESPMEERRNSTTSKTPSSTSLNRVKTETPPTTTTRP